MQIVQRDRLRGGLVALLGAPIGYAAAHTAFTRVWWAIAVVSLLGAVAAVNLRHRGPAG